MKKNLFLESYVKFLEKNAKLLAAFIFEKQQPVQDISMLQKKPQDLIFSAAG